MQTYNRHVSLDFPLAVAEVAVCCQSVASFHGVDDGDVAEKHNEDRDEEAEDKDGDDVRAVDARGGSS